MPNLPFLIPPFLLLSLLLASLYGVAFYFIFGRGWLALGVYWPVALIGFALGQILSKLFGFTLLLVGSVSVIEASAVSLLALLLTRAVWRQAR